MCISVYNVLKWTWVGRRCETKRPCSGWGSSSRSRLMCLRARSLDFFDRMGVVTPNFGFPYLESVYPDLSLEEDRLQPLQCPWSSPYGRSAPYILLTPAAAAPSYHKPPFSGQVKECSTRVHVKMWILIVKTVFCKHSYINLSAYSLVQIYTNMIYTDVICSTEQNQFKKRVPAGMNPSFP